MELEAHLNKESVLYLAAKKAARRPYVYKRGKHAKTLIREAYRPANIMCAGSNSPYPKILDRIWQGKCQKNIFFDNQNHEDGNCSCKCTPIPKENHSRHAGHAERKPEKERY